jgi:hypothetical protein
MLTFSALLIPGLPIPPPLLGLENTELPPPPLVADGFFTNNQLFTFPSGSCINA